MLVGYARVSSRAQETYLQVDALKLAGVRRIYQEKASSIGGRPVLQKVLSGLSPGDVLIVYKIDRVARSLKDLLGILDRITAAGAGIRSLSEPLDTTSPMGVFVLQILGAVAQLERTMIRDRAIAGQVAAYNRGVRWGGSLRQLSDDDRRAISRLKATGWFSKDVIADIFDCSISTVYRADLEVRYPQRSLAKLRPVLREYL